MYVYLTISLVDNWRTEKMNRLVIGLSLAMAVLLSGCEQYPTYTDSVNTTQVPATVSSKQETSDFNALGAGAGYYVGKKVTGSRWGGVFGALAGGNATATPVYHITLAVESTSVTLRCQQPTFQRLQKGQVVSLTKTHWQRICNETKQCTYQEITYTW